MLRLLLLGEGVRPHVHGQHQVRLLDDLLAVELEVRVVQQQRVVVLGCVLKVPPGVIGEALVLRVDVEALVKRDVHRGRRVPPGGRLLSRHTQGFGRAGELLGQIGRAGQVPLRHQVGVDVVVLDRAVLIRSGHALDPEPARGVVLPERAPEPGRLDQQLQADFVLELLVLGGVQIAHYGVGDVRVDVEGRGPSLPVTGALLAPDRPPRERGALQAEVGRMLLGVIDHRVPPAQGVGRGGWVRVHEHGQDEGLGVPERVPVVTRAGQALGGDRPVLGPGSRLQDVEQPEAGCLLDLGVAVHLDVGAVPELVQECPLLGQQAIPAREVRGRERPDHLVDERGTAPSA